MRPSSLYNENSWTGKPASLYWNGLLSLTVPIEWFGQTRRSTYYWVLYHVRHRKAINNNLPGNQCNLGAVTPGLCLYMHWPHGKLFSQWQHSFQMKAVLSLAWKACVSVTLLAFSKAGPRTQPRNVMTAFEIVIFNYSQLSLDGSVTWWGHLTHIIVTTDGLALRGTRACLVTTLQADGPV